MATILNPVIVGGGSDLENPSNHSDTTYYENSSTTPGVNRYIDLPKKYEQAYLVLFTVLNGDRNTQNVSPSSGSASKVYSYKTKGAYALWGWISVWKLTNVSGRINITTQGYGAYWSLIGIE